MANEEVVNRDAVERSRLEGETGQRGYGSGRRLPALVTGRFHRGLEGSGIRSDDVHLGEVREQRRGEIPGRQRARVERCHRGVELKKPDPLGERCDERGSQDLIEPSKQCCLSVRGRRAGEL